MVGLVGTDVGADGFATFEADLGYAFIPQVRTTLGIDCFGASIDREVSELERRTKQSDDG